MVFKVGLALLELSQATLLQLDMEDMLKVGASLTPSFGVMSS